MMSFTPRSRKGNDIRLSEQSWYRGCPLLDSGQGHHCRSASHTMRRTDRMAEEYGGGVVEKVAIDGQHRVEQHTAAVAAASDLEAARAVLG
jgi:hypothetical protein